MDNFLLIIIAFSFVIGIFWLVTKNKGESHLLLNQKLDSLNQQVNSNLHEVTKTLLKQMSELTWQMNERLRENREMTERSHKTIGDRLDNAAKSYGTVTNQLGKLEESSKRIFEVGKDLSSLQEILQAPKLRGNLGELFLGDLLAQVLPKEHYSLQYAFKNGLKLDAVIYLKNKQLLPIDAKFPLENFKKTLAIDSDDKEKKKWRKLFINDVKKHIEDISTKYIRPDEGTLDFALMYIPAENVYYEIIIKESEDLNILETAGQKRVFPVSPNSFYAYLQTILLGLKGMQIETKAWEIAKNLARLKIDFQQFSDDFGLLGKHLNNTKNIYEKSELKIKHLNEKMEFLAENEEIKLIDSNIPG